MRLKALNFQLAKPHWKSAKLFHSRHFILSYTLFLDEKISFSTFLFSGRVYFLTRKFDSRYFYYLVGITYLRENFTLFCTFITSYTPFIAEKISFSTLLLPHFFTRKFHSLSCCYFVDLISWREGLLKCKTIFVNYFLLYIVIYVTSASSMTR